MATKVGEVFISLAVDAASGNLSVNELVGALGKLDVASVATVGILSKITGVLSGMATAAANTAVEMSELHDITGADPKIVQQWEKAAQRINVHAGSIVSAVRGVNDMMGAIAARKSAPPMEMTGWLGITPQKGVDAQGRPMMKSFFELMTEIANPKNRYWSFTPAVQQQLLGGAFPGGDSKDLFRILNEMRSGKFRPQDMNVLQDKQISELTGIRKQETEMSQRLVGIFDRLLIGGGGFARILESINIKLEAIDKWLASKQGNQILSGIGEGSSRIIRNASIDPRKAFGLFSMGVETGQDFGRFFGIKPPAPGTAFTPQLDNLTGKLDINILGAGGKPLGSGRAFLGTKVTNADVEQITINAGNGGLGQ